MRSRPLDSRISLENSKEEPEPEEKTTGSSPWLLDPPNPNKTTVTHILACISLHKSGYQNPMAELPSASALSILKLERYYSME